MKYSTRYLYESLPILYSIALNERKTRNCSILHQYNIFRAFILKPLMLKHQIWTFSPSHTENGGIKIDHFLDMISADLILLSFLEIVKTKNILGDEKIRYTFSSNHSIHKSSCGICYWDSDPLIDRFY